MVAGRASRDARWAVWVVSYIDPLHPDEMLLGGALVVTDDGEVHEIDSQHNAVDQLMCSPEMFAYADEQLRKLLKDPEVQRESINARVLQAGMSGTYEGTPADAIERALEKQATHSPGYGVGVLVPAVDSFLQWALGTPRGHEFDVVEMKPPIDSASRRGLVDRGYRVKPGLEDIDIWEPAESKFLWDSSAALIEFLVEELTFVAGAGPFTYEIYP